MDTNELQLVTTITQHVVQVISQIIEPAVQVVVEQTPAPPVPWWLSLIKWVFGLVAKPLLYAGLAFAAYWFIFKKGGGGIDKRIVAKFKAALRVEIARTLDSEGGMGDAGDLKEIAEALVPGDGKEPVRKMPANLMRVDYELNKTNSDSATLHVVSVFKRGGDFYKREAKRDFAWEDLPKKMRYEFIRGGKNALHFNLFDRLKKDGAK